MQEQRNGHFAHAANGAFVSFDKGCLAFNGSGLAIVEITPDIARALLDLGGPNRSVTRQRVEDRRRDLRNGDWRVTNDALIVTTSNHSSPGLHRLGNGQHRLTAISEEQIPGKIILMWGVPDDVLPVIDTGRPRSAGDVISMGLFGDGMETSHAGDRAAAVACLLRWEQTPNPWAMAAQRLSFSPEQTAKAVSVYPLLSHSLAQAHEIRRTGIKGGSGRLWAPLLLNMNLISTDTTQEFVDYLAAGLELTSSNPIYTLRERLKNPSGLPPGFRSGLHVQEYLAAISIKTFNLYSLGETPKRTLSWSPTGRNEDFPILFRSKWWYKKNQKY